MNQSGFHLMSHEMENVTRVLFPSSDAPFLQLQPRPQLFSLNNFGLIKGL